MKANATSVSDRLPEERERSEKTSLDPGAKIYHVQVPRTLMARHRQLGLHPRDLLLWATLRRHGGFNGDCFPSEETLATELGVSTDTVQRSLKKLVAAELVDIRRRRRGSQGYQLLAHRVITADIQPERRGQEAATVRNQERLDTADARQEAANQGGQEAAKSTRPYSEEKKSPEEILRREKPQSSSSSPDRAQPPRTVQQAAADEDDDLQPIKAAIGRFTTCGDRAARAVLEKARVYDPGIPAGAVALLALASVPEGYKVQHAGYFPGAVKQVMQSDYYGAIKPYWQADRAPWPRTRPLLEYHLTKPKPPLPPAIHVMFAALLAEPSLLGFEEPPTPEQEEAAAPAEMPCEVCRQTATIHRVGEAPMCLSCQDRLSAGAFSKNLMP